MARKALSLANTENASFSVGSAKIRKPDGLFVTTEDESGTNNRLVYYTVRCKSCKEAYSKTKVGLARPHDCPACGTKHLAATPKAPETPSNYKKQTILALSDTKLVLINDNKDNAIVNQTPDDYLKWHNFGRKVFVSRGHMEFELDSSEEEFTLPLGRVETPEQDAPESSTLSKETEDLLADLEGYHKSLEDFPAKHGLSPHNEDRANFEGWLVSEQNYAAAKEGRKPYTDARRELLTKIGSGHGLYDTFLGMPTTWVTRAAGRGKNCRGWLYVYRFNARFDPATVRLPEAEEAKYHKDSNSENIKYNYWLKVNIARIKAAEAHRENSPDKQSQGASETAQEG